MRVNDYFLISIMQNYFCEILPWHFLVSWLLPLKLCTHQVLFVSTLPQLEKDYKTKVINKLRYHNNIVSIYIAFLLFHMFVWWKSFCCCFTLNNTHLPLCNPQNLSITLRSYDLTLTCLGCLWWGSAGSGVLGVDSLTTTLFRCRSWRH